jgi:hypothetical protein
MTVTEPDAEVIAQLSSDPAAKAMLEMILTTPDWIHRRSERVSFLDGSTTRRRTTVDLTVPFSAFEIRPVSSGVTYRLLLVDIAAKVPLVSFDIRNEAGEPIPVLSRTQNGILASNVLIGFAGVVAAGFDRVLSPQHLEELHAVACGGAVAAAAALHSLRNGELKLLFEESEVLDSLAATLVRNFLLVCAVPVRVGERRVVKVSYDEQEEGVEDDGRTRWHKTAEVLGVRTTPWSVPCGSLPDGESYHLEVDVPPQIEVVNRSLVHRPDGDVQPVETDAIRFVNTNNGVHLNVSRAGDASFDPDALRGPMLQVWMRAQISTWLLTAFLTTTAVSVMLWATWPLLDEEPPAGTDPAALLAGIVALLLVLVNQPAEHPLSARLLGPARVGSLLSALLPLVAAWLLAFSGRSGASDWWLCLIAASAAFWLLTALPFIARLAVWLGAPALWAWAQQRRA